MNLSNIIETISKQTPLQLKKEEIHVWFVPLSLPIKEVEEFTGWLSEDEKKRSTEITNINARECFLFGRIILRRILANVLGTTPNLITFSYNIYGKPFIYNKQKIEFNLSNTNDMLAIAVTVDFELGIDIEKIDQETNISLLAKRIMTIRELHNFQNMNINERDKYVYQLWTQKEAFMKAIGVGLGNLNLNELEIINKTTDALFCAKVLKTEQDINPKNIFIKLLEINTIYIASIAVGTNHFEMKNHFI